MFLLYEERNTWVTVCCKSSNARGNALRSEEGAMGTCEQQREEEEKRCRH